MRGETIAHSTAPAWPCGGDPQQFWPCAQARNPPHTPASSRSRLEGGRGKCQTRTIVWHADGACPNRLRKARSARASRWGAHGSGAKWRKGARSAYREFIIVIEIAIGGQEKDVRMIAIVQFHSSEIVKPTFWILWKVVTSRCERDM